MRQSSGTGRTRSQAGRFLFVTTFIVGALSSGRSAAWAGLDIVNHHRGHIDFLSSRHLALSPGKRSSAKSEEARPTYVDMSATQLADAAPELKRLEPAENQDMLPQILKGAGAAVATFFDNFPNTACTEHLVSTVEKPSQFGMLRYDDTYNYMALAEKGSMLGRLREYRANAKGELAHPEGIVTWGFVALSVNFHPMYQPDSRFRYLGREEIGNQDAYVVAFAQQPQKARQPASAEFLGKKGVVYLQGIAWVDPENFRILRLRTDIEQPELNVGLQSETVEVRYSEVTFTSSGRTLWLPKEVTVMGRVNDYVFHNLHSYSDYRLFDVEVDEKMAKP